MLLLPWLLLLLLCKVIMCRVSGQMHKSRTQGHRGAVSSMHYLNASPASFLTGSFLMTDKRLERGNRVCPCVTCLSQLAHRPRGSVSPRPRVACMHTTSGAIGCSRFHRFGGGAPPT